MRKAAQYVLDGAASPMEAKLALLLTLPRMYGGYGLPAPVLNEPLEVNGKPLRCDALWPLSEVALEYDSDTFHTGGDRIAHDSRRRNALAFSDLTTITVTTEQIQSRKEMDYLAAGLARLLNARIRMPKAGFVERQVRLRREFGLRP